MLIARIAGRWLGLSVVIVNRAELEQFCHHHQPDAIHVAKGRISTIEIFPAPLIRFGRFSAT